MKKIYIIIFIILSIWITHAMAMTLTTGKGYYTYNGQVIAKYDLPPGVYPDSDVNYVETATLDNITINQTASCRYYQGHNPTINMNCS